MDDPVKLCDFQLLENRIMKTVDSVYQVRELKRFKKRKPTLALCELRLFATMNGLPGRKMANWLSVNRLD